MLSLKLENILYEKKSYQFYKTPSLFLQINMFSYVNFTYYFFFGASNLTLKTFKGCT